MEHYILLILVIIHVNLDIMFHVTIAIIVVLMLATVEIHAIGVMKCLMFLMNVIVLFLVIMAVLE